MHHYGDPCIHCGTAHDDVPVGPCAGDARKQIPIAYTPRRVRSDGIEEFSVRMSGGETVERAFHVSEHVTRFDGWLAKAKTV